MILRDYQSRSLDEIRAHLRAGRRSVLWQLPTGGGKTLSTSFMLKGAAERGKRAWFVVHRRELIHQSRRAFTANGVEHGVIAAGFDLALRRPVQIASVQTLARRLHRLQPPDLIVWDECHHVAANTWGDIYDACPQAKMIGLSATPERLDGRGLSKYFEAMVRGPTVAELIDAGHLSKYRLFAPISPDLGNVHTRMGDYVKSELTTAMDRPQIVGDAVEHYRKHAMGRRAIVFAVSIVASQRIVDAFNSAGIRAEHVDGDTDPAMRDGALERLRNGQTKIVSNVDLFGEGFDAPAIEAVILLRPTQSLGMYLQQVGRGLRPSPGKDCCVILDHAGNCKRHGLPDDDREWSLEGTRGEGERDQDDDEDSDPVRQCGRCFAISRATAKACKECGTPFPITPREVDEVAGDLAEVSAEQLRKVARREQGLAATLDALIELATMRGYKNPAAWARHVFTAREAKGRRA